MNDHKVKNRIIEDVISPWIIGVICSAVFICGTIVQLFIENITLDMRDLICKSIMSIFITLIVEVVIRPYRFIERKLQK